ncbi:MAG: hypothetical protein GSR81_08370 [Desulfurococcales archaeon]|nr:hypothetical protein [Desulfurococcales archaeon]
MERRPSKPTTYAYSGPSNNAIPILSKCKTLLITPNFGTSSKTNRWTQSYKTIRPSRPTGSRLVTISESNTTKYFKELTTQGTSHFPNFILRREYLLETIPANTPVTISIIKPTKYTEPNTITTLCVCEAVNKARKKPVAIPKTLDPRTTLYNPLRAKTHPSKLLTDNINTIDTPITISEKAKPNQYRPRLIRKKIRLGTPRTKTMLETMIRSFAKITLTFFELIFFSIPCSRALLKPSDKAKTIPSQKQPLKQLKP